MKSKNVIEGSVYQKLRIQNSLSKNANLELKNINEKIESNIKSKCKMFMDDVLFYFEEDIFFAWKYLGFFKCLIPTIKIKTDLVFSFLDKLIEYCKVTQTVKNPYLELKEMIKLYDHLNNLTNNEENQINIFNLLISNYANQKKFDYSIEKIESMCNETFLVWINNNYNNVMYSIKIGWNDCQNFFLRCFSSVLNQLDYFKNSILCFLTRLLPW